jgi:hypothetical protein
MTTQLTPQEQYRIYGVVLRHLSPIQKGIQFNHAVVGLVFNYGIDVAGALEYISPDLFKIEHYSSVLLQCNSTNELDFIIETVADAGFPLSVFYEPDLGAIPLMTAIAFQVPMEEKMKWDAILANNPDGIEVPEIWTVLNSLKLAY